MAETQEGTETLWSRGGVSFAAPTYAGEGYSAPFGISAPMSSVFQSPQISPVFSPTQTTLSGLIPQQMLAGMGYGAAAAAPAAPSGIAGAQDNTMTYVIVALILVVAAVGVYLYTQR